MYKELAIIAPTASGKTALSISLAKSIDAVILSLDSLSVYKYIDIASAKPTINERDGIKHFGIDILNPNQKFDVMLFIDEYKKASAYAKENNKNLIIVGGTSFYLKSLIDGISIMPKISSDIQQEVKNKLLNLTKTYEELYKLDKQYMQKIASNDKYRIQKVYELYLQTNTIPSEYFEKNKPQPIVKDLKIFEIDTNKDILRQRISLRTQNMIDNGLIDEVISLEKTYTREPNCMASIGIKETLDYLDGKIDRVKLIELISIHTNQLAKRQKTYNKSQFKNIIKENLQNLENKIKSMI